MSSSVAPHLFADLTCRVVNTNTIRLLEAEGYIVQYNPSLLFLAHIVEEVKSLFPNDSITWLSFECCKRWEFFHNSGLFLKYDAYSTQPATTHFE